MAWNAGITEERDVLILPARADGTISPYRIVIAGTDADEVQDASSGTSFPIGVSGDGSENNKGTYADHDPVNVKYAGIVKIAMTSTGARGDRVVATTNGEGTRHDMQTEGVWIIGYAMESWTDNQVIPVLINRQLIVDTESIDTAL
jgi:hypothetical protein